MNLISFDCLLVTVGPSDNAVDKPGRVVLVNSYGECIYDKYIFWNGVIDYRTYESGIFPEHIATGKLLKNIQVEVSQLIKGCLLVGHFVKFHLRGLGLSHPDWNIRDTASYGPFIKLTQGGPNPLRTLASRVLGTHIQRTKHDCYENALTSLKLYNKVSEEWENQVENEENSDSVESSAEEEYSDEGSAEEEYESDESEEMRAVALDCEMVGIGPRGSISKAARVSLVDDDGDTIYDEYIYVNNVTDYRTFVSGIMPHHLDSGKQLSVVKQEVSDLIRGCLLVGHSVHLDLKALGLCHPEWNIRDVSEYPPFRQRFGEQTPSLKSLAWLYLGMNIQSNRHSSVEDAFSCMMLYKKEWEDKLAASYN